MRSIIPTVLLLLSLVFSGCSAQSAESRQSVENEIMPTQNETAPIETKQPVLVELFTSEGCSSCPPADKQLTFLEKQQPITQAEIITLAFHVDYWNYLGWKDEFSSPEYSQRQGQYAQSFRQDSNYTPQMVVDGQAQFVGSNSNEASKAITGALKMKKGVVQAALNGNMLKVSVSGLPKHEASTAFLAIAEDGIATDVKRGENAGSKLPHTSIVRTLQPLGMVAADADIHNSEAEIEILPAWKRENLKFIVFVQENASQKIIAVGKAAKKV
ncbi:hypothetical protein BH18ACI3_BH18ACI3_10150 [soil metagenome]